MLAMAGPSAGAAKIEIPRWIQLVGLPLVLLFLWVVAGAARHVVFLFLVAALIAFLLNPIVRTLTRVWIPRGLGVALVYLRRHHPGCRGCDRLGRRRPDQVEREPGERLLYGRQRTPCADGRRP